MKEKLKQLISNGTIKSFVYREQIPTDGDVNMRLIDELDLIFPNGDTLKISTGCSGCLENTSLFLN
jgi:hypothetical protein